VRRYTALILTLVLSGGVANALRAQSITFERDVLSIAQADEQSRLRGRSGLEDLSHEMSTCAAYFSLLSSVIQKSAGAETKAAAERTKLTGRAMLTQAINIAKYIGMDENVPLQQVKVRLKEMVETINNDPPNSLKIMHTKYGQPCDELLIKAPQRFIDLLQDYGD
jgi:hypothetical protein